MQNVIHKAVLRYMENNIQMHFLHVVCKYTECISRDQVRLV
jgi:hypothetical protein